MVVSTGLPSPSVYKYSYYPNGNSLASYRAEIDLCYNRCQKYDCTHQVSFSFCFGLFFIWNNIKRFILSYGKLLIFHSSDIHHYDECLSYEKSTISHCLHTAIHSYKSATFNG